jgi:hypothetical protein
MRKLFITVIALVMLLLSACREVEPRIVVSNMYVDNSTSYTLNLAFKINVFEQTKKDTTFYYSVPANKHKIIFSLKSMPYFNNLEYPNYYDTLYIKINNQTFKQTTATGMLNMNNYKIQDELTHTEGNYIYYERYFTFDDDYLNYLQDIQNN